MSEGRTERKVVPVDRIHPNEWNPNHQSDSTFNHLVEEIKADGFDHPLQVVPCSCEQMEGEHYKIIGGEHRWRAVQVLGWEEVECTIYLDWDEIDQKLKTVRRNLLTGKLDEQKFTELVHSLEEQVDVTQLPDKFGFDSEQEFLKHLIQEKETHDNNWLDALMRESKKEVDAVDGLSDILNNIFSEYGETVPDGYLFFSYKGKTHLMVVMDSDLRTRVEKMVERVRESAVGVNEYLTELLKQDEKG